MKRYHDHLRAGKRPEEEVTDSAWVTTLIHSRVLQTKIAPDGNHRAPKFRIGSRTSSQRAGFKKRRGGRK